MEPEQDGRLLRIFVGESDHYQSRPLYEAVVEKARQNHLAGATVVRGIMGFGPTSRLHSAKLIALSDDLPIIIEIVDRKEKIEEFLPVVDEMVPAGLVTIETITVLHYRAAQS